VSITFETGSQLSELAKAAFSGSGLTSIHLPASVTVIGASCFFGCGSLASITFESGSQLSRLAKEAFAGSGLTSIHLPASVTVIGESCFSSCDSLVSITFDPASKFRGKAASLLAGLPLFSVNPKLVGFRPKPSPKIWRCHGAPGSIPGIHKRRFS
jgi:hypothetical protein